MLYGWLAPYPFVQRLSTRFRSNLAPIPPVHNVNQRPTKTKNNKKKGGWGWSSSCNVALDWCPNFIQVICPLVFSICVNYGVYFSAWHDHFGKTFLPVEQQASPGVIVLRDVHVLQFLHSIVSCQQPLFFWPNQYTGFSFGRKYRNNILLKEVSAAVSV